MTNKNYKLFLKAKDLIKENQDQEAIKTLRKIRKAEPNDNVVKFELAKLLIKDKETIDKGKSLLLNLLNTQKNKIEIMLSLN